ncbi:AbrB/MazE/SpoVT family DNA-binding domain-containing protein [Thalassococcus sp. BH17M4-6]|uniref:AbrB/MazE/SpoVT family DNA-binding domain-containing protein n=1 Tax=Thalassococcus sp. BH17M4-6 TaxID=3413148 RepID=UPI003BC54C03
MQVANGETLLPLESPADLVRELGLEEGDQIDLVTDDGRILVRRRRRAAEIPSYRLRPLRLLRICPDTILLGGRTEGLSARSRPRPAPISCVGVNKQCNRATPYG